LFNSLHNVVLARLASLDEVYSCGFIPQFCFVWPTVSSPGSFTDVTGLCQSDPGLISAVSPVIIIIIIIIIIT